MTSQELSQEIKDTIRRLALENALKFNGKANPKALVGHLLKEHSDAKKNMPEVMKSISQITNEVNTLLLDQQKKELLILVPNYFEQQSEQKAARKEQRGELPELPNAQMGKVVTRIPPEPSKYNHLGHAMSFLINYLYAKKYCGKAILRFDDTNPEKSSQEFVDAVFEDVVNFLEIKPDKIKYASDNMDYYYDCAQKLIANNKAYICTCAQDDIKTNRREKKECSHRNNSIEENQHLWEQMKAGSLDKGSHVLRLKIDMQHKNAVMRDPVIYRLSYTSHYRVGNQYKVWPMYDFETAIEEGRCGVTHVMRSNEFDQRIELQNYIASLFGFPPITYKHYGRYNITGATTQGREIRALIQTGDYLGWDDPRLVTICALRRRGIVKDAFYELAKSIGLSKTQTNLDFSKIAAVNRSLLDKTAKRFFAIKKPVLITITNIPNDYVACKVPFHAEVDLGVRTLSLQTNEFYIEEKDNASVTVGQYLRLKDAMNIKKVADNEYEFVSKEYNDYKTLPTQKGIIQFVPKTGAEIITQVTLADISRQELICEPAVMQLKQGDVIQFERWAFCRCDTKTNEEITFWYGHD
ncbi:MAG: glutamate--tRNA ligase [Candidatus Nanoarchaeia archaeon]